MIAYGVEGQCSDPGGIQQGLFVGILPGVPSSSEIKMLLSSRYREGISHRRLYDLLWGEAVFRVTFLLLSYSQIPSA